MDIVYHIKRAIYFGATRTLYYEEANYVNLNDFNNMNYKIEKSRYITCKIYIINFIII